MQNIPKRNELTELDLDINARDAVRCREGRIFVSADYSNLELRSHHIVVHSLALALLTSTGSALLPSCAMHWILSPCA